MMSSCRRPLGPHPLDISLATVRPLEDVASIHLTDDFVLP